MASVARLSQLSGRYTNILKSSQRVTTETLINRNKILGDRRSTILEVASKCDGKRPEESVIYRSERDLFDPKNMELDARWLAFQKKSGFNRFQIAAIPNRGLKADDMRRAAEEFGLFTCMLQHPHDVVDCLPVHQNSEYMMTISSYMSAQAAVRRLLAIQQFDPRQICIFPATGFLAETDDYQKEIIGKDGIFFGGASAKAMKLMGDKQSAQVFLEELYEGLSEEEKKKIGVAPLMPSMVVDSSDDRSIKYAEEFLEKNGTVMVKASGGGGGAGIEEATNVEELLKSIKNVEAIAKQLFPGSVIKIEKKIVDARHIESQGVISGDTESFKIHGEAGLIDVDVMNAGDRDCSLQRLKAKLLEEDPTFKHLLNTNQITQVEYSEILSKIEGRDLFIIKVLTELKNLGYKGPITMEFLYDGSFYFMEANTRIQIENPVTGMGYGDPGLIAKLMIAAAQIIRINF